MSQQLNLNISEMRLEPKEFVNVPVFGQTVIACRHENKIYIPVGPLCDTLGIGSNHMIHQLRCASWAIPHVVKIHTSLNKSGSRGYICIELEGLLMMFSTIRFARIKSEVAQSFLNITNVQEVIRNYFFAPKIADVEQELDPPVDKPIPVHEPVSCGPFSVIFPPDSDLESEPDQPVEIEADPCVHVDASVSPPTQPAAQVLSNDSLVTVLKSIATTLALLESRNRTNEEIGSNLKKFIELTKEDSQKLDSLQTEITNKFEEIKKHEEIIKEHDVLIKKYERILGNPNWLTVSQYLSAKGHSLTLAELREIGKKLSKYSREKGIEPTNIPHSTYDQVHTYPVYLMDQFFKDHPVCSLLPNQTGTGSTTDSSRLPSYRVQGAGAGEFSNKLGGPDTTN